jgi:hypothetical protein
MTMLIFKLYLADNIQYGVCDVCLMSDFEVTLHSRCMVQLSHAINMLPIFF